MPRQFRFCVFVIAATVGTCFSALHIIADEAQYTPHVSDASNEGELAIPRIRVPEGFKVELWAAEPMLANPVAFCLDERGRIYVAETFRQQKGVEDNRNHMDWLDDDLAAMTVDDRLAYFKKRLGEKVHDYTKEHDRIRLLEDRDGDGRADSSTVFADGFHDILDGTGAGLLARRGNVWYTNIPHLWLLRDEDGDGKADSRKSLHRGYGVRVAFRGHDLHGLRFGPDGRLYFSCGDRGFNITTAEGKQLVYPDQGAVLRCNPDGTELEVYATGLRNPQELAFDEFGNLFTGDNNCDSGDKARWVYVVEGGDSGWRMNYQYLSDRGPWNREKLWHTQHEGQPAYIVPPLAHIADGPSGLTYYPGAGFPEQYAGHFFLVDFRGGHVNSGVRSIALKPKGAAFDLTDSQEFAWSLLATDADFGADGALYVSDWVEGWDGPGKGRIYKISFPAHQQDSAVAQAKQLIAEGFDKRPVDELAKLLAHPHMQVRMEAQFALADHGQTDDAAIAALTQVAARSDHRLARLHAIWGLGQIGRRRAAVLEPLVALLADADAEVRAQAAKVLGDESYAPAAQQIVRLLKDESPRVRFFAAVAYGKMGKSGSVAPLIDLLRENADSDVYLRHAAVTGLCETPSWNDVVAAATDPAPAVRMGVLLAMRRAASPEVAKFLDDIEPKIVDEAARAIHDVPIVEAFPQLAARAGRGKLSESTLWRVVNANFRLGGAEHASAVARIAASGDVPEALRVEAVRALVDWAKPSGRDRVLGSWRPLPERDRQIAAAAFHADLAGIFRGPDQLRRTAIVAAVRLQIKEVGAELFTTLVDKKAAPESRVAALEALQSLKNDRIAEATELALADESALVRVVGRRALARTQPAAALETLASALESGELIERQAALATLAEMKSEEADSLLVHSLDKLLAGDLPVEMQLDVLEAAARRDVPAVKQRLENYQTSLAAGDPLAPHRVALAGGSAERGRRIFFDKSEVSCVRCHKVAGRGGEVGPDLSKIGEQQKRDYLLESIVLPDKQIAKGFDTLVILTEAGKVISGIVKADDGKQVQLITAEGSLVTILKSEIDEQSRGKSAMPEDLIKKLSPTELRDLLEFLATLK